LKKWYFCLKKFSGSKVELRCNPPLLLNFDKIQFKIILDILFAVTNLTFFNEAAVAQTLGSL